MMEIQEMPLAGPHPSGSRPSVSVDSIVPAPAALVGDLTRTTIPLSTEQLYRPANLSAVAFQTTADLVPAEGLVGQQRAMDAIGFGTRIKQAGFNLFVIGPNGALAQQAVETILRDAARDQKPPADWVYVNNFVAPQKPIAIQLPAGRAAEFRDAMHELVEDLKVAKIADSTHVTGAQRTLNAALRNLSRLARVLPR